MQLRNYSNEIHTVMVHGYPCKQDINLFLHRSRGGPNSENNFLGLIEVVRMKFMKVVIHEYGTRFIVVGLQSVEPYGSTEV